MILLVLGAALLIAAVAAAIAFAVGRGGDDDKSAGTLGPCTLKTFPAQGMNNKSQRAGHVTKLPKGFKYNSFPPTSAPLPQLGKRIALAAWTAEYDGDPALPSSRITHSEGRLAMCTAFDEDAFSEFRDDYRYNGVERFPPDQLQPGM